MQAEWSSTEQVARLLKQCLDEGSSIEIDGLGTFRPHSPGRFQFVPMLRPKVFLAYADEDQGAVAKLYDDLSRHGFDPWMDKRKLLPGQNWPRAIEGAIGVSDFFVPCFSSHAACKRGYFQSELRYAMECAARLPLDEVYLVPVRLDECAVPARISREIQWVDLFPDWEQGLRRMVASLRREASNRKGRLRLAG